LSDYVESTRNCGESLRVSCTVTIIWDTKLTANSAAAGGPHLLVFFFAGFGSVGTNVPAVDYGDRALNCG
jgi:hypothetical protein